MIDDQSEAGQWKRALDRGCLEGRVTEYFDRKAVEADLGKRYGEDADAFLIERFNAPYIPDRDWPEQLDYLKRDHRPTRNEWVGRLLGILHYDYDRGHTRPGSLLSFHDSGAST